MPPPYLQPPQRPSTPPPPKPNGQPGIPFAIKLILAIPVVFIILLIFGRSPEGFAFIMLIGIVVTVVFIIKKLTPGAVWRAAARELAFSHYEEAGTAGRISGTRRGISITVVPVNVPLSDGRTATCTEYRAYFRPGSFEFSFVIAAQGVNPDTGMPPCQPTATGLPRSAKYYTDNPQSFARFFNEINTPVIAKLFDLYSHILINERGITVRVPMLESNKDEIIRTIQSLIRSGDILDDRTDIAIPAQAIMIPNSAAPEPKPESSKRIFTATSTSSFKKMDPVPTPEVDQAILGIPPVVLAPDDLAISAIPELSKPDLTITPLEPATPLEIKPTPVVTPSASEELTAEGLAQRFFSIDTTVSPIEMRDQFAGFAFDFTGTPPRLESAFRVGKGSTKTFNFTIAELPNKYGGTMPVRLTVHLPSEMEDPARWVGKQVRMHLILRDVEPLIRTFHADIAGEPQEIA